MTKIGYKQTEEHKNKISEALEGRPAPWAKNMPQLFKKGNKSFGMLGKKHTEETKRKISLKNKGKLEGEKNPMFGVRLTGKDHQFFGKYHTEETKRKISEAKKGEPSKRKGIKTGRSSSTSFKKGFTPWNKGKKNPKMSGENSPSWKGGITPINLKIRTSLEYKLWQDSIFCIDGYACKKCNDFRISKLVAHHILNFSSHIDLRLSIDNGITMCRPCHKEFHHKYGVKNNTPEQIKEFLNN